MRVIWQGVRGCHWWIALATLMLPAVAAEPPIPVVRSPIVSVSADQPDTLVISGLLNQRAWREFAAVITDNPKIARVMLDSNGGQIGPSTDIASGVYYRGLTTIVPPGAVCYSGCAQVFLAGKYRLIGEGAQLGVHQMGKRDGSLPPDRLVQFMSDQLRLFRANDEVIRLNEVTPFTDIHIFTPDELMAWGIVTPPPDAPAVP